MRVKILNVGDVVGGPGRTIITSHLGPLCRRHCIDCAIVNAENAASGSGLTPELYRKFTAAGANLITMGDHIYRKSELIEILNKSTTIVRPANFPRDAPGREYAIYTTAQGPRVAVISLLGRLFMKPPTDCPFRAVDRVLGQLPDDIRVVVVEVHAEATSEKVALGWHLDGRVSLVCGTHTHVVTADERVLPKGTAYITDIGMTGPYDSVLGRIKERVIGTLISAIPSTFEVATGDVRMSGIITDVDAATGRATAIQRVMVAESDPPDDGDGIG